MTSLLVAALLCQSLPAPTNEPAPAIVPVIEQSATQAFAPAAAPVVEVTPEPSAAPASEERVDRSVDGFYPLWEATGFVLGHRRAIIGTSTAQFGVADTFQLGLRPGSLVMRVPNIQAKAVLYANDRASLAAQLGALVLLPGASSAFLSSRYKAAIENHDSTIIVAPASLAASVDVFSGVTLHNTLTAMTVIAEKPIKDEVTVGDFLTAELLAHAYHSFLLHAGQVGIGRVDAMTVFGASYRLHYGFFEGRIGYFYRKNRDGMQSNPQASIGLVL